MIKHYIKLIIGIVWRFGWNFRCDYCGKPMFLKKFTGNHDQCEAEHDRFIEEMRVQREVEEYAYFHMLDILDGFCDHYGCWGPIFDCGTHYWQGTAIVDVAPYEIRADEEEVEEFDEDGICDGCGQRSCVCPELASLARHNADPATRGSYWVA